MAAFELDALVEPVVGVGAGLALGWPERPGVFRRWPSALASGPGAKAATGGNCLPASKFGPVLPGLLGWKNQIANSSSNVAETTIILRIMLEGWPVLSARGRNCEKYVIQLSCSELQCHNNEFDQPR